MKSGRALRRKKTNLAPALANSVTMYAPGIYPIPYGANGVLIGGRGASGTAPTGGNYAGGGNAYSNPTYIWGYSYTVFRAANGSQHDDSSVGDDPWGPKTGSKPPTRYYTANYSLHPGFSTVNYTISGSSPGYTDYNPTYYNPYYPGSSGPTAVVGGVTFPGGTANVVTAPSVAPALSTFTYKTSGISITVPPGGFVTLTPID